MSAPKRTRSKMLSGKTVVLGVTGGIAAYKALEITSRLKKLGANVRVVMSENARAFVAPLSFETLSGNPVYISSFEKGAWEIEHISLAKSADLMLVAPATANLIGKHAHGIADDLLTTTLLAVTAPVLLAPAMNAAMYRHPATQANLEVLRGRGVRMVGPDCGRLACGDEDIGRMSEPGAIVDEVVRLLSVKQDLLGKKIVVTAGPTREALDPVRFLTNRSSGRMGYAIAEAARNRGADVTLVSGPVSLPEPGGVRVLRVSSTQDLFEALTGLSKGADCVIQAAAPADFTARRVAGQKIKKTGDSLTLELVKTPDIAMALGQAKTPGQVLVAFAAETNDVLANAREKLLKKNADLLVANDVTAPGAGFDVETNVVTIIDRDGGQEALPLMDKRDVADAILDRVAGLL